MESEGGGWTLVARRTQGVVTEALTEGSLSLDLRQRAVPAAQWQYLRSKSSQLLIKMHGAMTVATVDGVTPDWLIASCACTDPANPCQHNVALTCSGYLWDQATADLHNGGNRCANGMTDCSAPGGGGGEEKSRTTRRGGGGKGGDGEPQPREIYEPCTRCGRKHPGTAALCWSTKDANDQPLPRNPNATPPWERRNNNSNNNNDQTSGSDAAPSGGAAAPDV